VRSVFVHGGYNNGGRHGERQAGDVCHNYGDAGGPSRFFHVSDWSLDIAERLAQADPVFYCAKSSRSERDAGLKDMPLRRKAADQEILVERVHTPDSQSIAAYLKEWRLKRGFSMAEMDERLGTNTAYSWFEGRTSGFRVPTPAHWLQLKSILNFDERYDRMMTEVREVSIQERMDRSCAKDVHLVHRIQGTGHPQRNPHPTVKPIKLTQWLATLLLPPAAYAPRRLLIPFSGVASEGIGAMLAGWEEIVMVEQDASYCEIARHRLAYWVSHHG
jgi:hypothetical protein